MSSVHTVHPKTGYKSDFSPHNHIIRGVFQNPTRSSVGNKSLFALFIPTAYLKKPLETDLKLLVRTIIFDISKS